MRKKVLALTSLALAIGTFACGKGKSDSKDTEETAPDPSKKDDSAQNPAQSGVTEASGDSLSVVGTLALALGLNDAAKPNKVLVWVFDDQGFDEAAASFDVAADGTFKVDVPRKGMLDLILSAKRADGSYDKEVLKKLIPGHDAEIDKFSDAELGAQVEKMQKESEGRGGHMAVLTSIDDASGSKMDQAESMRFVGLPGKGGNMSVWPVKSAKGNFSLGKISASGKDEATTELKADSTSFDLAEDAVASLTTAGKLLKSLKNVYINGSMYRAEPFFQFFGEKDPMSIVGAFSNPADAKASRSGFYVAIRQTDLFTFDQLCDGSKVLEFVPPSEVDTDNGKRSPTSPYNSKGTTPSMQGDKSICGGGETGIYLRKDSDDGRDIEVNWSIKGTTIPEGWWKMRVDGIDIGFFDLGTANPIDAEGKATVFVPKAKVDVNDQGKVTKVTMIPTIFDKDKGEYIELTDLRAFRQLTSEVTFSINDDKGAERRGFLRCGTVGNVCEGTMLMGEGGGDKESGETALADAGLVISNTGHSNLSVSYKIGDVTLRTEFQKNYGTTPEMK